MRFLCAFLVLLCAGCASYRTPGGPAPFAKLGLEAGDAIQPPAPQFPLRLALVRVQAPGYRSYTADGSGQGRYSVVADDALADETQLQAVAKWPALSGAARLDASLLPAALDSLGELRLAAAKMQADVLLVYTLDTSLHAGDRAYEAAAKIALEAPDGESSVASAASAVFIDVRTGYDYGSATAGVQLDAPAETWRSREALDGRRVEAERQAFAALLAAAQTSWRGIVARFQ